MATVGVFRVVNGLSLGSFGLFHGVFWWLIQRVCVCVYLFEVLVFGLSFHVGLGVKRERGREGERGERRENGGGEAEGEREKREGEERSKGERGRSEQQQEEREGRKIMASQEGTIH